jgi:hypothetical protein
MNYFLTPSVLFLSLMWLLWHFLHLSEEIGFFAPHLKQILKYSLRCWAICFFTVSVIGIYIKISKTVQINFYLSILMNELARYHLMRLSLIIHLLMVEISVVALTAWEEYVYILQILSHDLFVKPAQRVTCFSSYDRRIVFTDIHGMRTSCIKPASRR